MALAKGASMAGTATCSGEGGMIPPERDLSTKWYYQIIQSRYGFNPHHLMLADAVEFFIGQGCKVGLGGHLMGQKVTEQVAEMRSLPPGIDQRSPARHPDWLGPDDLSLKIQETREATNYEIPIQLKLGAARVYDDVRMAAKCGPDIIYLDGAEGGTGAGPHIATEETGIPLMAAIPEARRALEDVGLADEIDLVVAGGIRNGGDIAKCIALGAKAVAIGTSALIALGSHKESRGSPTTRASSASRRASATTGTPAATRSGITTQDPELRKRLNVDEGAERVYNFLHTLTLEVQMLARACGKTDVHSLEPEDLCALTTEAAAMAKVPLGRHQLHPRRHRGARAGAHRAPARARTWRTRSTSCPIAPRRSRDEHELRHGRRGHRRRGPLGQALPLPGGRVARSRTSTCEAATPGDDINWLEDITLLVEEGTPAVFDRYSNAFIKIYFPIPEGQEDEVARKVLIKHLQEGNSYGIQLKEAHAKFPQPELGPWVEGSRRVGENYKPPGPRGLGASDPLMSSLPKVPASVTNLVIGAGVHGLSTAWHLAADGEDVLVVDKTGIAAGASGIACGVVRNNYFQPAMQSSWPPASRSGSPIPRRCTTTLRLHRARPSRPAGRPHRGLRAPGAHRLPQRAAPRRRGRRAPHAQPVLRLARAGADGLPARARGGLRVQQGVDARPRRQGARAPAPRSSRASR